MKSLWEKIKIPEKLRPYINAETVSYLIFGVLTTLLDLAVFELCYHHLAIANPETLTVVSNTIAWVAAVIFAFVTNKLFVFKSRSFEQRLFWREFFTFVAARLLTWGISSGGMVLLVDVLGMHEFLAKVLVNIIVIILNYVFSKLFVFRKKSADGGEAETDRE